MAMTKEDYAQLGRHDAEGGGASSMGDASETSWQYRAYMTGYNSVKKVKQEAPKLTARQEHIRFLRGETNRKSITANRLLRINHKIMVLQGREAACAYT